MLEVDGLNLTYRNGKHSTEAVGDLTFNVSEGEFVCIVGPSGCGKTTLLRCLSGLIEPTGGLVTLEGRLVDGPPDDLALVFQDFSRSLMPWLTVRRNVELPLKSRGDSREERTRSTEHAIESVGLTRFIDHYPWQLSGGMQQRVAIARALAYRPRILLMDEPFASVDAQTRADLEDMILDIREEYDVTALFVTHDIDESVYLADRVVALSPAPTSVREEVEIPLPRPRDQVETKELSEFAHLRTRIWRLIKHEDRDAGGLGAGPAPSTDPSASQVG